MTTKLTQEQKNKLSSLRCKIQRIETKNKTIELIQDAKNQLIAKNIKLTKTAVSKVLKINYKTIYDNWDCEVQPVDNLIFEMKTFKRDCLKVNSGVNN